MLVKAAATTADTSGGALAWLTQLLVESPMWLQMIIMVALLVPVAVVVAWGWMWVVNVAVNSVASAVTRRKKRGE